MNNGGVIGIDGGRALQKCERRQRLVVGGVLVKIDIVGGHPGILAWRDSHILHGAGIKARPDLGL